MRTDPCGLSPRPAAHHRRPQASRGHLTGTPAPRAPVRPGALLLLTAPLWVACLTDEAPTRPDHGSPSAPAAAQGPTATPRPASTSTAAGLHPDPQTATATATLGGAPLLSEEERADGCVYALAELRGVSNPALARSAAGNRARAAMKARLRALQDALPAELRDSFQSWRSQAQVEIPALQALGRRHWQAKAQVRLEGAPPAAQAALLGSPPDAP